jgi:hypothetical protein
MYLNTALVSTACLVLAELTSAGRCKDPIVRKEWYAQRHFDLAVVNSKH